MISRLGVLGGMFDPVHNGHLEAARHAVNILNLDRLKMIPCNQPNHRDQAFETPEHRIAMLRQATLEDHKLEIDDCEISCGGISCTVDTLAWLQRKVGSKADREVDSKADREHLVFVLGMDSLNSMTHWHQWEKLFDLCHLFVLARGEDSTDSEVARAIDLDRRRVEYPEQLFAETVGAIYISSAFDFPASSSEVRRRIALSEDLSGLLHEDVRRYIAQQRLYS